jgi:hypothetical protein
MTSTIYKSKAKNLAKRRAGFGVIMVSAINAIEFSKKVLRSDDVQVQVREVSLLFNLKYKAKKMKNRLDLEALIEASSFTTTSNAHDFGNTQDIRYKNQIFHNYFEFRNLDNLIALENELISARTLGVHLRGTDKAGEIQPPSKIKIVENIKVVVDKYSIEKIFLATDDIEYVKLLENAFGTLLIRPTKRRISTNGKAIHLKSFRKNLNREMIEDVYLLSKCPYILYSKSNVSYLAVIIGLEWYKFIAYVGELNQTLKS